MADLASSKGIRKVSSIGRRSFLVGSLLTLAVSPTRLSGAAAASETSPAAANWVLCDKDL